jgi:ABC-type transport system involved in multi-copper enzyme maturation permease subunit
MGAIGKLRESVLSALRLDGLHRLAGPVFDKELRVSARRGRNYALRFAYLVAMTIFVAMIWSADADRAPSTSATPVLAKDAATQIASRMAEAGRAIVRDILAFEFLVLPLLASIMLSAAVSEEMNLRTLDVLMSTPTTAREIIRGKIASKMLQLILLLAISLPLLMTVRAFGGVPWQYVVMGLLSVLLACLYVGSITAYFATRFERPYEVVPVACLTAWITLVPTSLMRSADVYLMKPGADAATAVVAWIVLACVALVVSYFAMNRSAHRLRMVGSRRSHDWVLEFLRRPQPLYGAAAPGIKRSLGSRKPVGNRPVLWREWRSRFIVNQPVGIAVGVVSLVTIFVLDAAAGTMQPYHYGDVRPESVAFMGSMSAALMLLGLVGTAIVASGGIAHEKEAGTLMTLLSTPLSRREIVLGKAAGAARRSGPLWLPLVFHLAMVGFLYPGTLAVDTIVVQFASALGLAAFTIGLGLWVSSRLRKATIAGAVTAGVVIFLFVVAPYLMVVLSDILDSDFHWPFRTFLFFTNPLSQSVEQSDMALNYTAKAQVMFSKSQIITEANHPGSVWVIVRQYWGSDVWLGWAVGLLLMPLLVFTAAGLSLFALTVRQLNKLGIVAGDSCAQSAKA